MTAPKLCPTMLQRSPIRMGSRLTWPILKSLLESGGAGLRLPGCLRSWSGKHPATT